MQHWALFAAATAAAVAVTAIAILLWRQSRSGRLRRALKLRRQRLRALAKAAKCARRAKHVLSRLQAKSATIAPNRLVEAEGRYQDCRRLAEIAADQLLVAENRLRKIIVEEFPPGRHEALRQRYRLLDAPAKKPFSFDGTG
ncbi:MAG: hypothetical protein AAFX56_20845 [Pseudomonadota bacterium]